MDLASFDFYFQQRAKGEWGGGKAGYKGAAFEAREAMNSFLSGGSLLSGGP